MIIRAAAWRLPATLILVLLTSGCALLDPKLKDDPAKPPPPLHLEVQAPAPLKALLEQHLDLARLAQVGDDESLDDTEWARLVAAAPAQARELLQTEGYFEPQIKVERSTGRPVRVRVLVQPGPRVRVASVRLQTEGELERRIVAGDRDAIALRRTLEDAGPLAVGVPFRNADWRDTKLRLATRLRGAGYAAATVADSGADVDVAARSAAVQVTLDSGPLFLAGPVQIEGLAKHDEATVRHLAGFGPGAPLTETRLLDYQDRLQKSGLFEGVSVTFDPDAATALATPVLVRLRELPLQQATAGVGFSANTGPRTSLEHTHRRLFGWAVSAHNKLEWGRDAQSWNGDFYTHPGQGFYRNLLGVQIERVRGDDDDVLSQRLRLGRTTDTPRLERLYFGELLRSRQSLNDGTIIDARATSANAHYVLRRLDSVLLPTRGYSLSLQLGAGQAQSDAGTSGPFARVYSRFTAYWPLGADWYASGRVEAGEVIKRDAVRVPDQLGFRAGGDDSVRGYGHRELAPRRDGKIFSGNVLLTSSVELARPISQKLPAVWGAVFVDAGRAADQWKGFKPALGYGVGVRWRSPIGPLKVDLAWGEEVRKARLHLTVGITF
ncbi:BamA/TamA family outer membrane protein [Aquincola sp. S2]|uniref:BamA/TamA family outer membrane protein n=1 Tax=Pseudaquabacterium terrae TaxID=2732868 RepID=A0ABX2EHH7_9BURK|nr:BamA/TamA family outer membrane protein [Aquabacterium terrae]